MLAQLAQRGLVATMTLSHTKSIDIWVTNQTYKTLYKVEVKTTQNKPASEKVFGSQKNYFWIMGEKHEKITDPRLFYAFVYLIGPADLPKFFIVPSRVVARYVGWQHQKWLKSRMKKGKSTTMRKFRIPVDDAQHYENNWKVFSRGTSK